jgi:hypothetical protein
VLLHRAGQADALDAAQALVVHADGAGVVDQLLALFKQQHLDAVLAEGVADGQADGAGADDDHVGIEILSSAHGWSPPGWAAAG